MPTQICGLKKNDSCTSYYQFDCMTDTDTQTENSPNSAKKTPSKGKPISKSKPQKGNKKQRNEDPPKKKQQNEDPPKKAKAKKVVDRRVPKEDKSEEQKKKESKRTEESVDVLGKKESKKVRRRRQEELAGGEEMSLVQEYMQKQNRPYNILNVFDNLHGKVKKPLLESILTELTEQGELTCKQFGKNKLYYPNQKSIDANVDHINQLSEHYTTLRDQEKELSDRHRRLTQDSKKLLSKKTIEEIESVIEQTAISIAVLKQKISRVGTSGNIDEKVVAAAEKRQAMLRKELGERRRLVKELIDQWSVNLQQKRDAVAELMGVDL